MKKCDVGLLLPPMRAIRHQEDNDMAKHMETYMATFMIRLQTSLVVSNGMAGGTSVASTHAPQYISHPENRI